MGKLHVTILTDHAIYVYISGRFKIFAERNNTELRIHIWQLKDQKKDFTILPNDVTCVVPRNSIFHLNRSRQRLTSVTNLYQLVGTSGSSSLNSIASLRTNHKYTCMYCFTFEYCNGLDHVADVYI